MASGVKNIKKKVTPRPRPLMTTPHFDFEREAFASGHRWVAGVDEVGRGPLAGPVGVAAVILDPHDLPEGLNDLKALLDGGSPACARRAGRNFPALARRSSISSSPSATTRRRKPARCGRASR